MRASVAAGVQFFEQKNSLLSIRDPEKRVS